jgi:hypothetical protein
MSVIIISAPGLFAQATAKKVSATQYDNAAIKLWTLILSARTVKQKALTEPPRQWSLASSTFARGGAVSLLSERFVP